MNHGIADVALVGVPALYVGSALLAPLLSRRFGWLLVQSSNALVLALALLLTVLPAPHIPIFSTTPMQLTVMITVALIGFVVARFSTRYLDGDAGQQRFQGWLQLTLGCVSLVVTSNHLMILIAAWAGISVSMHQLLMFYPERKRAALAAHKKFLFARLAEACLIGAAVLLYTQNGTLFIDEIMANYRGDAVSLSFWEQLAAVLIASAAMIKCAQFPMHGWLIQVVEAPTPVSALLHAGVINLGGFLILLMAPLMVHADLANWLLLIVAGLTCVAAALITMTRISIKVLLAWSTVAQMGLMLVECALGQYGLALLHLVAHSCYKAYAFLSSGGEVESYLRRQMAPVKLPSASSLPILFAGVVAVIAAVIAVPGWFSTDASLWLLLFLMPVVLLSERSSLKAEGSIVTAAVVASGLVVAYGLQKMVFSALAPASTLPGLYQSIWCALLFSGLLFAYWLLRQPTPGPLGRLLYRNLYAGFYLDEWSTRVTLALWPARLPQRAALRRSISFLESEKTS